ncbi:Avirulence (Avh) protein [Phytophthora megakarya]|uniref:Avirulence (Avh) protein n=1 Tax=Phytophthora megakarya TaxID=4795 RepID=A0A225V4G2_9STRA|nr:Avirulence (Avh) protein [Phytophthora megakarya]
MGLHYLLLVFFLEVVSLVGADSVNSSNLNQPALPKPVARNSGVTSILRISNDAAKKGTDERMGLSPALEKMKSSITSAKGIPTELQGWMKRRKSDYVFKRLGLTKAGHTLFDSPKFVSWVQYTDDLSANNPTNEMFAISTLTRYYGDKELLKLLKIAKMNPSFEKLAAKLEAQQIQYWIAIRKDPDAVFDVLRIEMGFSNLFGQPVFAVWAKYVDDLNAKYTNKPASMIPTLKKHFSDYNLFRLTEAAKDVERTKGLATKVQTEWLQTWLQNRKSPDKALNDLRVEIGVDTIQRNPLFNIWTTYMRDYAVRYPEEKTTMVASFTKTFGDAGATTIIDVMKTKDITKNIAAELGSAQLRVWLMSGKSTDEVFKLLTIDKSFDILQDKWLLNTWLSYMNVFFKETPNKMNTAFNALRAHHSDRPLNIILNEANKFSSMESIAKKFQEDMILGYIAKNEPPREVFRLLGLDRVGDSILTTPLFQSWMKFVEDFNKRNPTQHTSWVNIIRMEYKWGAVDRMIVMARQNPRTADITTKLET